MEFFHSVTLDKEKCTGCTNCIKRCPTEAIRVRNKRAYIIPERCIDCGECIRVCPHHAKKATCDSLDVLDQYEYTIALPAPAFYGQFNNMDDIDILLRALIDFGFDEVYEVAKAAELVSAATRKMMKDGNLKRPVISSACPAVTRLIRVRFPNLIEHVLPLNAPVELAARLSKGAVHQRTGIPLEKIGAIFISPCAAKVTASKMPLGTEKSEVNAVISINDIYQKLISLMHLPDPDQEPMVQSGKIGIAWGTSSGEAAGILNDSYLAADGIENVIRVLEDLEDEKFSNLEFIELNACSGGCVGGVLTVENPYIAKAKLKRIVKYMPVSMNHIDYVPDMAIWDTELEYAPVLTLDPNMFKALEKMQELEAIQAQLPGLDCGSCGAPSCRALAEDVVRGLATPNDCIIKYKESIEDLLRGIHRIESSIPAPFRTGNGNED